MKFLIRHWTVSLVSVAVLAWAVFFVPNTPTFAVIELTRAIRNRNPDAAVQFVDFDSVVKHAGYQMADRQKSANDPFSQLLTRGAVEIFYKPIAQIVESIAREKVASGDQDVQIPLAASVGATLLLHRNGNTATTSFRDHKNREWEIRLARNPAGRWQIVEVDGIASLIERLQHQSAAAASR
ncbi:MAG TPA: hypothetical protein VGI47_07185 [Candidatus Binataceae bacterium]